MLCSGLPAGTRVVITYISSDGDGPVCKTGEIIGETPGQGYTVVGDEHELFDIGKAVIAKRAFNWTYAELELECVAATGDDYEFVGTVH